MEAAPVAVMVSALLVVAGVREMTAQESCVFPFIYRGVTYHDCTMDGWNEKKYWCATTSSYDRDHRWIVCNYVPPPKTSCVFPFIYRGVSYDTCTMDGWSEKKYWCATTSNYDKDPNHRWIVCNDNDLNLNIG
ncbi:seminal plasma protein pB1-like [Ambystoma mexicanum]|uniref:seminal plasma protein pB1-like n=1 Tax=Ambystoma mexicanum TaxID=8296 RepID=UPI0037E9396D